MNNLIINMFDSISKILFIPHLKNYRAFKQK